jgi:hypothetical protein
MWIISLKMMLSTALQPFIHGYAQTYQHYPQEHFHKTGVLDALFRQIIRECCRTGECGPGTRLTQKILSRWSALLRKLAVNNFFTKKDFVIF